ncbi:MAG TPA: hypothetical protein VFG55_00170 [Rhodanobacteraceae bacterium]|nr:hypothetical protein [Rhodanobacteraceae bacterium]
MDRCKHARAPATRMRSSTTAAAALGIALFAAGASAADGDLDPTFGTGGYTLTGITGATFQNPPKPVVLPDGRILVCSVIDDGQSGQDFFVARLDADGALDTNFDFDGRVTIDFDSRADSCSAIAAQADGKILLAGSSEDSATSNSDFAIARLNADGSLDPTFGAGTGKTLVPFDVGGSDVDIGDAITVQPDGKILVAGWANTDTNGDDFALVRLLPDGTRDTTFNSTGRVTVGFDLVDSANRTDQADAVMIDPNGHILLGGIAEANAAGGFDFALVRLLSNGQLDTNFSADGRATIAFDFGASDSDVSYQSILQRDGKIVMIGAADTGSGDSNFDAAIARLLPDGSPDPAFGIGGKVVVPFDLSTNGNDIALGVVEDSANRLAVVGVGAYDAMPDFHPVALRLLGNGDLDPAFGAFGKKTFDFGATTELFTGVALQGTQIIAGGLVSSGSDGDNIVARLEVDLVFADGFE